MIPEAFAPPERYLSGSFWQNKLDEFVNENSDRPFSACERAGPGDAFARVRASPSCPRKALLTKPGPLPIFRARFCARYAPAGVRTAGGSNESPQFLEIAT